MLLGCSFFLFSFLFFGGEGRAEVVYDLLPLCKLRTKLLSDENPSGGSTHCGAKSDLWKISKHVHCIQQRAKHRRYHIFKTTLVV